MANKKTTLKTQTGDNVYPNVLKENLPAAVVFYGEPGQAGEGNEGSGGSAGSAGGAAAAEASFETVVISDDSKTYTGTITGTKPLIIKQNLYGARNLVYTSFLVSPDLDPDGQGAITCTASNLFGDETVFRFKKDGSLTTTPSGGYYQHCITLTSTTLGKVSCNFYSSNKERYTLDRINSDVDINAIACSGVIKDNNKYKIATDIYKIDSGSVYINWIDPSDGSTGRTRIDNTFTVADTVRSLS